MDARPYMNRTGPGRPPFALRAADAKVDVAVSFRMLDEDGEMGTLLVGMDYTAWSRHVRPKSGLPRHLMCGSRRGPNEDEHLTG